jgi:nicotinamidase-related amidase
VPVIPGLPGELSEVPVERDAWLAWRSGVLRHRAMLVRAAEGAQDVQRAILRLCAADPAYFVACFGWIFEPRKRFIAGWAPFVPFAFQVDLLREIEAATASEGPKGDLVVEKARDMGATWTCCLWALWGWLFGDGFVVGLVSRNERLVDDPGNPDSMFYKIEGNLDRLPDWVLPAGWTENQKLLNQKLKLVHPSKTNAILGESTTANAGRAGRGFARINDESAVIPRLNAVVTAQKATTDHVINVSSANMSEGPDFRDLAGLSGEDNPDGPRLARLTYDLHPFHDDEWLEAERKRYAHDPEGFELEVLMNYDAGLGQEWVYAQARRIEPDPDEGVNPHDSTYVSFDPGRDDDTAIVWFQERAGTGKTVVVEAYSNRRQPADFYASLLAGIPDDRFLWDYGPEEERIMGLCRDLTPAMLVGDPYGAVKSAATGESFYDRLGVHLLRARGADYPAEVKHDKGRDFYALENRRQATRILLARLAFAPGPGPERVLEAVRNNRFPTPKEARETTAVLGKPLHDGTSHYTTAVEFFAVWRRYLAGAIAPRPEPRRTGFGARRAA